MKRLGKKTIVPRADRSPVNLRGFALSDSRDRDVVVADVSYTGCGIPCDETFRPGEVVELRIIKRGAMLAEIRWAARGRAGAQFLG